MPVIKSLLDTDLYKLTMQKAVLEYRQNVPVRYVFNNRRPEGKFNESFAKRFEKELQEMKSLSISEEQLCWLKTKLSWLGEEYIQYLLNYRFDPSEVMWEVKDNELRLDIQGTWERTILWEVPLMALISELFFQTCDTNWSSDTQKKKLQDKGKILSGLSFTDFGTRRRRNYSAQHLAVNVLKNYLRFNGTSNVHIAQELDVPVLGTMAHEWIMGISALESLRHANRHALRIWQDIYKGRLGIALTDTFHTDTFFNDFDNYYARLFDGVRHDSGDPFQFVDKTVQAYHKLNIPPTNKVIIFSDGLSPEKAVEIARYCVGKINPSFGIGTNFTNDFEGSPALNMVIKLSECNGVPVVKLSDTPTKAIGDKDALRVAKWTFFKTPLDA